MTPAALIARLRELEADERKLAAELLMLIQEDEVNGAPVDADETIAVDMAVSVAKADALAEAMRRIEASTWRPIASAPKDIWVIVWWFAAVELAICTQDGHNWSTEYGQTTYGENPDGQPTYWQPLPLPPAPATGDV